MGGSQCQMMAGCPPNMHELQFVLSSQLPRTFGANLLKLNFGCAGAIMKQQQPTVAPSQKKMIIVISNALLYYSNKDEKPIPMIKEKQLCKKSKKVIFAFPKSINLHHRDQKESVILCLRSASVPACRVLPRIDMTVHLSRREQPDSCYESIFRMRQ